MAVDRENHNWRTPGVGEYLMRGTGTGRLVVVVKVL